MSSTILAVANLMSSIQTPNEDNKQVVHDYAKQVGMDEANTKGLEVLATEGPSAMFAHMVKESGGDYSRMMAMYH